MHSKALKKYKPQRSYLGYMLKNEDGELTLSTDNNNNNYISRTTVYYYYFIWNTFQ